jgi:hypothetical protein
MKQPVAKKAVNALSKPSFEDYYKSIPEYKNDTVSYDLQSAYEELPYSQMKRFAESNAHLPDTYKKPTHPTFSNESKYHNDKTPGGYWDRDTKGRDRFTPSQYNIDNMGGPKEYMKWFQENEKGVILNMPYEQTQPTSFINNYFEDVVRADKGLSLGFRTGEKWSIVEDLKGPSHADGGIDLFFNSDGVSFSRYGKTIKAEKGLIITNGVISGGDLSKLGAGVRPSADANTSNAPTSTIQPLNPNVNTSLIGKTWDDIPTNNPAYNQPQLKQDTRTDYERQRDQEAMTAYQNPTILEQVFGGARMVTRAVADPIQGIGQVFDAVGLGDTRIGQDLGNFNDEEAQYRYRNLNPNIDAGEKFMSNLGEGSEVAALGLTNFIPFESSVINPIVKGLVGKGNYSSYLANPLYSSVVNQGVKEVVEGSVVKQVDDVIQPAKSSFQVKELPGLHLQSTMENGAISKIVDKTGKINTEQAFGIIAKESGGAEKLAIIKKGFGDNIPSKMDFNEFRKITQEQLIPLEKQFSTYRSNYGIERIGYQDITLNKNAMIDVENQIKYLIENEGIDSPNLKRWNDRLNELKSNVTPLENQTLILGNKSKFGRGSSAHGNPEETLGHIHFLRDAETPDVLTVTQIQSDAFQGTNRTMPKTFNKEKELINLAKMEYIVKQQKVELSKAIKRSDGYWELSDGTLISDDVYKQGWTMQEEFNAIKKAEIENFTQKQLLDKNHQERYIQEFVDYAGKRGDINKIRVPTSETAAKVQGYSKNVNPKEILEMLEEFKKDGIYEKKMSELNNEDKKMVEKIINKEITENTYYTEHQTILKKYSEQPKTIKKLFGEEPKIVTDSKGNTWYEFDIPKKFKEGKGEIKAFTTIPVGIGTVGAIGASQDK